MPSSRLSAVKLAPFDSDALSWLIRTFPVRPTHGDTAHLAEEVVAGTVDAAFVTLPLRHPDLRIEKLRRDRLVACLRRDDPLAAKASLQTADLQGNLAVLYHPQRHPDAHDFEDLKESEVLDICGTAGLFTSGNIKKVLDMQLTKRNMAAHPTLMIIGAPEAEESISTLIQNVVHVLK